MEDFLGLEDATQRRASLGPAFIPPARCGRAELLVLEAMHRVGSRDFPGAAEVLFTMDDETGAEVWDPAAPPDYIDEGKRWQKIMGWPTVPSIAEAEQFQTNARRSCMAAWWSRLAAARAEDEARPDTPKPDFEP